MRGQTIRKLVTNSPLFNAGFTSQKLVKSDDKSENLHELTADAVKVNTVVVCLSVTSDPKQLDTRDMILVHQSIF